MGERGRSTFMVPRSLVLRSHDGVEGLVTAGGVVNAVRGPEAWEWERTRGGGGRWRWRRRRAERGSTAPKAKRRAS